ncbi:MAG TPA: hypothetical protein DCL35_07085 [Candidatus Omnitrophica bacterium]|nr:hypothetical protein [Candidatus Omnitrophota bacterium]
MSLKEQVTLAVKESITEALTTIVSVMPVIKDSENMLELKDDGNVAVSLGIAGKLEGTIFILFSQESAAKIISKILGCDPKELTSDSLEGVGEVLNIIAGGIKTRLEPAGYDFVLSIPSFVRTSDGLSIGSMAKMESLRLFVSCADCSFEFLMFYQVKSDTGKTAYERFKEQKSEAEEELRKFFEKKG